jgi:protocatechuate 3,4-dioxygenase beta subunit
MPGSGDLRTVWLALAFAGALTRAAFAQVPVALAPTAPAERPPTDSTLRTFIIDKPVQAPEANRLANMTASAYRLPAANETVRATVGLGYVQGADWGTEIIAGGGVAGTQVQLNTLITSGREGFVLDQGALSIFDPDTQWRAEAGDIFSHLRGASRGVRFSLPTSNPGRRPAFAVYGPRAGSPHRTTVVSYRDQLNAGEQTLLDAEIASDKSFLLRNHLSSGRFDLEAFYRSNRSPERARDASVSAGVRLWGGIGLAGGVFQELGSGDGNHWRSVSVRFPLTRFFDLTLERTHAGTASTSQTSSAAMGSLVAGQLRMFHRLQQGEYDVRQGNSSGTIERQQTQSVASYNAGARVNVMLQLATQRLETGQIQHWEEMQTSLRLTSTTTLRLVHAIPDLRDSARWRGYFRQDLPARFALQADYGRLSAFQTIPNELDRSRFKLMLFRTWDVATPARGGAVSGRVLDDAGRPVAGAGVRLGPYTIETDTRGGYSFKYVPAGSYELGLDRSALPADVAWDGREEQLLVASRSRIAADLHVAPLNAIHGRVYCDANANGRFDRGEGVAGAVLHLLDRTTATDVDGSYTFANLWPSSYAITLDVARLTDFTASGAASLTVALTDDRPVTGVDFRVVAKGKPILWTTAGK